MKKVKLLVAAAMLVAFFGEAQAVDYDIVYVRQAYLGPDTLTQWPEALSPTTIDPGADLMLLRQDGSTEVLVDCDASCSVTDPFISFDGEWVLFAIFHEPRVNGLSPGGSDIYRLHLETREVVRLTESTAFDLGPAPIAGGRIIFTSSRDGYEPPKGFTDPTLQLYVMDWDGSNQTRIAPMNLSSALHPTPLTDGTVMFSSHESQGRRDTRLWGIWSIYPDGRNWRPLWSSFAKDNLFHFQTQTSDGEIVVEEYYNLFGFGLGTFHKAPLPVDGESLHQTFDQTLANPVAYETDGNDVLRENRWPFMPKGIQTLTPWTSGDDRASPNGDGTAAGRVGKGTHPSAAPNNDLLVVWTRGPANGQNRPVNTPAPQTGIYMIPGSLPTNSVDDLVLIYDDPNYNEAWPRAVVPWSAIHGQAEPPDLGWLPQEQHPALPIGTPYGLVGSSSTTHRSTTPSPRGQSYLDLLPNNLDTFNTSSNNQSANWKQQGADAGIYSDDMIAYVRILVQEPNMLNQPRRYASAARERIRILGEVPVRKPGAPNDTSWLAKIPADTPFTFQTLDQRGMVLNMAQTWHQVRPGEMRIDCGGCHAHDLVPEPWEGKVAAQPGFEPADLRSGVESYEFVRDIRPILQAKCAGCHNAGSPAAQLDLASTSDLFGFPADYFALAADSGVVGNQYRKSQVGIPPVIPAGTWRQTNQSRYVRAFQSRRSLLIWKLYGERLDGFTNDDFPSPDPITNAFSGDPNWADLDYYAGTVDHAALVTDAERQTFVRWIDTGTPLDMGGGFWEDTQDPAVVVTEVAGKIIIGAADAHGPVDIQAIVNGQDLSGDLVALGDGRWELAVAKGDEVQVAATDPNGNTRGTGTVAEQDPPSCPDPDPCPPPPPCVPVELLVGGNVVYSSCVGG